jgi:hypothetical protein
MLQGLILWATVGLLLGAVGYTVDTWQFWCFLATYWAVERIGRVQGAAQGIIRYLEMSQQEQDRIRKLVKEARGEGND